MIIFRQTEFGMVSKTLGWVAKNPTVPLSVAALGVSTANLAVNTKRHKEATGYQKKQLMAMDRLSNALEGVDNTIRTHAPIEEKKKKGLFGLPVFIK